MHHTDRNAHNDLIATPRGLAARNTPALPLPVKEPARYALAYYALVTAIASALFWSL